MAEHLYGQSSTSATLGRDQQADGARLGPHGVRYLTVLAMLFLAMCTSQTSAIPEQQQEPLATGEVKSDVSTTGQASTAPLERNADVSPGPVSGSGGHGTESPSPAALKEALRSTPDSVLVGTDVGLLSGYVESARPVSVPEIFLSEQGGATAEIQLVMGASGPTLTRRFLEPGTEAQSKRYDSLSSHANRVRLSGSEIEVLGLDDAILVWEKNSGVDGIPDSLWIRYEKAGRNGRQQPRR